MTRVSSRQSSVNLVYTAMNAGIVSLPFACRVLGLPLFCVVLGINALVSYYLSTMAVKMADENSLPTLEDLGGRAFGSRGLLTMCVGQICFSVLLIVASFLIWGDTVPLVITENFPGVDFSSTFFGTEEGTDDFTTGGDRGSNNFFSRNVCVDCIPVLVLGAVMVLPLCYRKNVASLVWCSRLSVVAMVCALMSVVVSLFAQIGNGKIGGSNIQKLMSPGPGWWWAGITSVNFCFFPINQRVFYVYNALSRRSPARWTKLAKRTVVILFILFLTMGVCGALVHDSLLINYFHHNPEGGSALTRGFIDVMRCVVALSLLLTVPIHTCVAMTCGRRLIRRWKDNDAHYVTANSNFYASDGDHYFNEQQPHDLSRMYQSEFDIRADDHGYMVYCIGVISYCCCSCVDWLDSETEVDPNESHASADMDAFLRPESATNESIEIYSTATKYRLASGDGNVSAIDKMVGRGEPIKQTLREQERPGERTARIASTGSQTLSSTENNNTFASCIGSMLSNVRDCCLCRGENGQQTAFATSIWLLSLFLCILIRMVAAPLLITGGITMAIASLILPSMIYFRLGVEEDFQAVPILRSFDFNNGVGFVPNRIYMMMIQSMGLIVSIGSIIISIAVIYHGGGPKKDE